MAYRITLERKDRTRTVSTEAWHDKDAANRELIRILAADYAAHSGTFAPDTCLTGGIVMAAADPMAEPPGAATLRGSGQVTCCGHHRERCTFGRQHLWSTWFEAGYLQRTLNTYYCSNCGGVCIAEEAA